MAGALLNPVHELLHISRAPLNLVVASSICSTISWHDGEEIGEDVVDVVDQCGGELILVPTQARGAWAGECHGEAMRNCWRKQLASYLQTLGRRARLCYWALGWVPCRGRTTGRWFWGESRVGTIMSRGLGGPWSLCWIVFFNSDRSGYLHVHGK